MRSDKEPKITHLPDEPIKETEPFTHYILQPVNGMGKEHGKEFSISKKGFEAYRNRTAKPDGTALKPQFIVKKKK